MQIKPDIIKIMVPVVDLDPETMAKLSEILRPDEEEWMEFHVDADQCQVLEEIFEGDWASYRDDPYHSFTFSIEFMMLIEPVLKRDDVDEIYFEMLEA